MSGSHNPLLDLAWEMRSSGGLSVGYYTESWCFRKDGALDMTSFKYIQEDSHIDVMGLFVVYQEIPILLLPKI